LLQIVRDALQSSKRELLSRGRELRGAERLDSGKDEEGGAASFVFAEGPACGLEDLVPVVGLVPAGLVPVDLGFAGE